MQRTLPTERIERPERIERIGPGDLMELASDVGPVPMNVGAVLVLDAGPSFDLSAAEAVIATRMHAIPRLRQRLVDVPRGCGRPIWVDDDDFALGAHVLRVRCPPPGDRSALLEQAVAAVTEPLPRSRPLWRAVFVTGLADDRVALVLVVHHVVADGIGGLAVLAGLVDGVGPVGPVSPVDPVSPMGPVSPVGPVTGSLLRAGPTRAELLAEVVRTRCSSVLRAPSAMGRLWAARTELGVRRPERAPRCSLNAPTGPRRRLATVEIDLASIRDTAHRCTVTVNDVLLAAVTGALQTLLRHRGEIVPVLVVSVPVSARRSTTTGELGNRVGVMLVRVPLTETAGARLAEIAAITRTQKMATPGVSASLVGPLFRLVAAVGLFRRFVDRQRMVNSFVTNLRGPAERLAFAGAQIDALFPVTSTTGNVSVAFAALSYAGTLTITVIVDPDLVPDLPDLSAALESEFGTLTRPG